MWVQAQMGLGQRTRRRRWEGATRPQRFRSLVSEAAGGAGCGEVQREEDEGREEPLLSSP